MRETETVLVTGAGKRVGRTIALALATTGRPVAVHYNGSEKGARETAEMIAKAGGLAEIFKADLANPKACEALVARVADSVGPVVHLVNSASIFEFDRLEDFSPAALDRHMALHVTAPALLSRTMASQLPQDMRGSITSITDRKITDPSEHFFTYTLSKAALGQMTRMLARALAPRIRVNEVAPGLLLPSGAQSREQFDAIHDRTPLEYGATPDDVAACVAGLIENPAITGQMICVDGGESLLGPAGTDETGMIPAKEG